MSWSKSLLQKLEKEGRIKKVDFPKELEKKIIIPKEIGKYKLHIISVLKKSGLEFEEEYKFDEVRRFRFDWAIEKYRIAFEYEGIFSEKSGHTTISGYTKDITKYNLATKLGWQILRYTADNYLEIENDLKLLIEKKYED
ncbi:hypothetical protein [Chryseobacterium indoltheticum]|uniref:DUF559 domain-containing protein n=1 Tax=Chryseobacterium indoltheticum TaxID=254 RepID=A0A3G6N304_9FLAO|nr:hypothetical protein [Chryseobacterium indoltheticum]AZA60808.1 hypothetical protein EG340_07030 [Chryseobacterium indoltheticum]